MLRMVITYSKNMLRVRWDSLLVALLCCISLAMPAAGQSPVPLADQPIFASADVPGNLALTLSVEYPTAISVANLNDYADSTTYYGYFDPLKCYTYQYNSATPSSSYFQPAAFAGGTNNHSCSGQWSGNFMNWATMQTIDPFRWALTGGYRSVDTTTQTILEKAWGASEGSITNFPYRGTGQSTGHNLSSSLIASLTPFSAWTAFNSGIWSNGNMMVFSQGSGYTSAATSSSVSDLTSIGGGVNSSSNTNAYRVYVRVSVCDTTILGTAGLESNCVGYGTATTSGSTPKYSIYKPEGLMQKYSSKIRFAALGYLNGKGSVDQGGVLREPMGFIGPTYPTPLSSVVTTNTRAEWSGSTGIMNNNPDVATANASGVFQSGVMNYVNKFGEASQTYMTYDNVSELYYAAVRYYENLGNVPEWTNVATPTLLDGFPAVTTWSDPIAYRCQKNFILGIGDDHTWYDYNVGGGTATGSRAKPAAVAADSLNYAATWTTALQNLEGITPTPWWPFDSGATYYMAGLAYGTHVLDMRPDLADRQTISTYWMDVMEYQRAENLNPYYLAAKYGGFAVPSNYSMSNTTPLPVGWYDTTNSTINMNGNTQNLPDNYFPAGSATTMVSSLTAAFKSIANAIRSFTTSFSLSSPTIVSSGESSFASQYDSSTWSSTITGSNLTVDGSGNITATQAWISSTTMQSQLAGTGWQNARRVATWNGSKGVAFEPSTVTPAQLSLLSPSTYASSATTSTMVLNYLRGDQTNEVGSSASSSTQSLRTRTLLLGDIVDAALTPVAAPSMSYSEARNPGYAAFKTNWASRPTVVYAGANDGMLHAFLGSNGVEQFAYVPSALFQGPSGTPQVNGLAALANPKYAHAFYVDATPRAVDIDLNRAGGSTSSSTSNWQTLLIGGLGKGGKSFYALTVTNPAGMTTEAAVAQQVAWEFSDPTLGYSFGAPIAVKTVKYGWVIVLTSGYDNSDGYGYLYFVNPNNGALLEKVRTPLISSGLTQASAYVQDYTDYTADSVYVGDLNGQLWRFDLTTTSGSYPAPTQIATLTDSQGYPQPVTSAPLIEIHPTTRQRYVMVGTGRLLASQDVGSAQTQTFYAIVDGTASSFNTVSSPLTRSNMTQVTDLLSGIPSSTSFTGWYYDMTGTGERVVIKPQSFNGIVAWASLLPSTDPCSPSGISNVYAVNFASAKTVLYTLGNATVPASYFAMSTSVTNFQFLSGQEGVELVAGDTKGGITPVPANLAGVISTRLLNWIEIPTAQ